MRRLYYSLEKKYLMTPLACINTLKEVIVLIYPIGKSVEFSCNAF